MLVFTVVVFFVCLGMAFAQPVRASWYGAEMGRRTANGARWNPSGLTCAHRSLPFGTRLRLTFRARTAVCTVTDRGPAAWTGRALDLSKGTARAIGLLGVGVAIVNMERLD